jgi:hypothetical protein
MMRFASIAAFALAHSTSSPSALALRAYSLRLGRAGSRMLISLQRVHYSTTWVLVV